MLRRLFLDHPRSLGESYAGHASTAARFGGLLLAAGGACLLHALVPALFPQAASRMVRRLGREMDARAAGARPNAL